MSSLKNKNALITGSTSGIGLGIATALAKEGANILLNGFGDFNDIEQKRINLEKEYGIKALYHNADMTKPADIENMVDTAKKEFKSIDILINNAGIQHVAPIDEFPVEKWDQIIAINLSSTFHTIRHCLPLMKENGWGRIINTASAHALVASPFKSAYVAAKHGIAGLTKTVALEAAEYNITVNAICPGYVKTPLVENQITDTARARNITEDQVINDVLLKAQPTKKFVTIDQVAQIALFLCSDSAENVNGALWSVDGGWTSQ